MPATSAGMTVERWLDLIGTRSRIAAAMVSRPPGVMPRGKRGIQQPPCDRQKRDRARHDVVSLLDRRFSDDDTMRINYSVSEVRIISSGAHRMG